MSFFIGSKPALIVLVFLVFLVTTTSHSQTFKDILVQVHISPTAERQAMVDSFMQANSSFPITEDSLVHFVYQGSATSVAVPGDFSGWDPSNAPMGTIAGTDFWYRTDIFDHSARLDYKYVINGTSWIFDPRNPHRAPGGFGDNSELRMPARLQK